MAVALLTGTVSRAAAELALVKVSYDPTREFYTEINRAFAVAWQAQTG